jgi:hypothetical protein
MAKGIMEGIELILHQDTGMIRGNMLRICRAEQVKHLFRFIEAVVSKHNLARVIVSLDRFSLLRSEEIRRAFIRALSERSLVKHAPIIWAGGSAGDAAFIRSASAVAKTSLQRYETEHEALLALQISLPHSPEAV